MALEIFILFFCISKIVLNKFSLGFSNLRDFMVFKENKSLFYGNKKNIFYGVIAFLGLLFSPILLAWGPLGHQAVCDAVWRASPSERQQILAMAAKRMGYKTYAQSCVWADEIRGISNYAWIKPLHYMNVPRESVSIDDKPCGIVFSRSNTSPECVFSAIIFYYDRFHDSSLSQRQRDEALLLLSHFVADIHQPLHVAYADDRGGTSQNVVFSGKFLSLHRLWDSEILYCGTQKRWKALGKQLFRQLPIAPLTKPKIKYSTSELTKEILLWAEESYVLTRTIYSHLSSPLAKDYCETFHPVAIERLKQASRRLSLLLNE